MYAGYALFGFPWIFLAWAYKTIPAVGECGGKASRSPLPIIRILSWHKKKVRAYSFDTVHPRVRPIELFRSTIHQAKLFGTFAITILRSTMISANPPGDEMTNILSRLPVKDLMQFRSVCKSWCNLIRDPHFVNMHTNQHASYKKSYLISKDILDNGQKECCTLHCDETFAEHKKLEFPLWESTKSFEVFGCCNGVLFLLYPMTPRSGCNMYFWNPATKVVKNLASSPIQLPDVSVHVVFGFGCVPRLNEYKVVRILYSEQMNQTELPRLPPAVEVYSLKTDSWAKIEIDLPYFITSHMAKAFLDGYAYWVARNVNETLYNDFIVSFNMSDHTFEEINLPKSCLDDGALTGSLAAFRDSLYLFVHGPQSLDWWHIWMMEEHSSGKIWCHRFKIDCSFKICWPLCFMKDGEVIFESIEGDLSLYDHRNQQFQDLNFQGNPDMIELFEYKESLVLLDIGTKSWPIEFYDDGGEKVESQTQSQETIIDEEPADSSGYP